MTARLLLLTLAFTVALTAEAVAARRLALVIGNDTYAAASVPDLRNAVNDSGAVAARLEALGFEVLAVRDADRLGMNAAVSRVGGMAGPEDTVLFFYAGHGISLGGENYLLPTDIPEAGAGEDLIRAQAIGLSEILERLRSAGPRMTLAIIDACRDNPFPKANGRSIGNTRGLSRMEPPQGSFVIFSAGAGQTALDRLDDADTDPNSVFTRTLLPLMETPGMDLRDLAVQLRREVNALAGQVAHRQTPAYYDEMLGDFAFRPAMAAAATGPAAEPAAADAPAGEATEAATATARAEPAPAPAAPPAAASPAATATADGEAPVADGFTTEERQAVRGRLAALGMDTDGVAEGFGPITRAAIRAWQFRQGLEGTGALDRDQFVRLVGAAPADATPGAAAPALSRTAASPDAGAAGAQAEPAFRAPGTGRYIDRDGCMREADGAIVPGVLPRCDALR